MNTFEELENTIQMQVAIKFSFLLKEKLSAEDFKELCELTDIKEDTCRSNDYIDANVLMSEAVKQVIGRDIDTENNSDLLLWRECWYTAKNHNFFNKQQN